MSCTRTPSNRSTCGSEKQPFNAANLNELVEIYQKKHDLHKIWGEKRSFEEAVFGAKPEKTDPHQQYFPKVKLHEIADHLAKQWNRNAFKDFEDLYDYVRSILHISPTNPYGKIKNPNALIFYDIALRLSAQYNVWPKDYVYLNGNGPSDGAKALGLEKLKDKKKRIAYSESVKLYPALSKLDAAGIEDFLCIYKNEIEKLKIK